ncbi:hypothetical protein [Rhizobium leguminosarum]|nr:hypothetical protein [Rhizobium leguminosarum]
MERKINASEAIADNELIQKLNGKLKEKKVRDRSQSRFLANS